MPQGYRIMMIFFEVLLHRKKHPRYRRSSLLQGCFLVIFVLITISTQISAQTNKQALELCVDPDWMPFEAVINGRHTGIASDYLALFTQLTPYSFNVKTSDTWQESIENLMQGECDLTLLLNRSVERETYLSFSIPYFFGPNVLVSKTDIPFMQDVNAVGNMTLGIVSGYRLLEEIPKYYPNVNIVVVDSEEDGLRAVDEGRLDVFVGSLYSINLTIEQLELTSLRVNGWISIQDKLRIGFTKANEDLVPIFNQAIDEITAAQHNEILSKWSNVQVVENKNYTLFYIILGSSVSIFIVFLWKHMLSLKVLHALNSKNEELNNIKQELEAANKDLEYLSFHDNLTTLYNRHYFLTNLKSHLAQVHRQHGESALLMIDLDYFKKINDQYGHGFGDKILRQFAEVLLASLRAGDVAARWGGEEFIILLPESDKDASVSFAKRLISRLGEYRFEQDIVVTISVGITQLTQQDVVDSWIERADSALYQAKRNGRNRIESTD